MKIISTKFLNSSHLYFCWLEHHSSVRWCFITLKCEMIFWFKHFFPVVSISSSLLYSIIYFEKNCLNRNKTFLNKLVSLLCSLCIEFGFLATTTDILRCFLGPFPIMLCRLEELVKISYLQQKLLILDAVLISRFIFIFLLKNPLASKDDFWSRFVSMFIRTSSFTAQVVFMHLSPNEAINVYTCAGLKPVINKDVTTSQINVTVIALFTVIVHVTIPTVIYFYKRKVFSNAGSNTTSRGKNENENQLNLINQINNPSLRI